MHELPIVKAIFSSVMAEAEKQHASRVSSVYLKFGVLREIIPEYMNKYWSYVSKGTILEGSDLVIEEIPAMAKCSRCGKVYVIDVEHMEEACCPGCGYEKGFLIAGREIVLDHVDMIFTEVVHG